MNLSDYLYVIPTLAYQMIICHAIVQSYVIIEIIKLKYNTFRCRAYWISENIIIRIT